MPEVSRPWENARGRLTESRGTKEMLWISAGKTIGTGRKGSEERERECVYKLFFTRQISRFHEIALQCNAHKRSNAMSVFLRLHLIVVALLLFDMHLL